MNKKNDIKMIIPSSLENLSILRGFVRLFLEFKRVDTETIHQLITIVDELGTNVVEHGYQYKDGEIFFYISHNGESIEIVVEDNGVGFDEGYKKEKKVHGGMGLVLARKLADDFKIEKKINGTVFKVEKKLRG